MYQLKILGKVKACGKFIVRQIETIWILITGFWNDNNTWDDTAYWVDQI